MQRRLSSLLSTMHQDEMLSLLYASSRSFRRLPFNIPLPATLRSVMSTWVNSSSP